MSDEPAQKCAHCGEPIEPYEPTIVLQYGAAHETSQAAEPELVRLAKWRYHRVCHDALQAAREPMDE